MLTGFTKRGKRKSRLRNCGKHLPVPYNRKGKVLYGHAGGERDCGISRLPDADGNQAFEDMFRFRAARNIFEEC